MEIDDWIKSIKINFLKIALQYVANYDEIDPSRTRLDIRDRNWLIKVSAVLLEVSPLQGVMWISVELKVIVESREQVWEHDVHSAVSHVITSS